jgi:hypothetical protein
MGAAGSNDTNSARGDRDRLGVKVREASVKSVVRGAMVGLCAFAVVGVAEAKEKRSPTEIAVFEAAAESIGMQLSSDFKGCVRERTVTVADGAGGVFETATSDRGGALVLSLEEMPAGISGLRIAATESRFGSRVCEAVEVDVPVDVVTLSGSANNGAFRGVLFSSVEACEPNRVISLYEVSADPVFVGFDFTDAAGAWTIAQAGGTYEARADRIIVNGPDGLTVCQAAVSAAWSFEDPPE